ncbi:MAG: metallophosphoesterase family protein [Candidatus Delongbacteria bacterium]|nr:metallophosphoesterase family protein [Candidatus Delongbacteria bacterium]MBN2834756.1 metallophosphoesterase family protein [Candidatus Delongbacteria bacterium]
MTNCIHIEFNEKMMVFGAPSSNAAATEALIRKANELDLDLKTQVICTGDIIAYCGRPNKTTDLLRENSILSILGNVEEKLISESTHDNHPGKYSSYKELSEKWFKFIKNNYKQENYEYIRSLPRCARFNIGNKRAVVVHGSYTQIDKYIFKSTPEQEKIEEAFIADAEIIIGGHCGLPFIDKNEKYLWFNPGLIGLPANDGTSRVWYGLIEKVENDIVFKILPLEYDFKSEQKFMKQFDMPEEYSITLETGLWPDESILPDFEKSQRGVQIDRKIEKISGI